MRGRLHRPQPMKRFVLPPKLSKTGHITPRSILKNHNKSRKNRKMKNPIVFDLEWVVLHNKHCVVCLLYIFCCSFKSMLFFIAVKNVLNHTTLCSLCRATHLEPSTTCFSILWFFCDLLWFFKTASWDNLTGFGKFRRWYRLLLRFRLGVM
jgi:hypothetical protein